MPRYTKSYRKSNWSHENKGCACAITNSVNGLAQGGSNIVPASTTQGTRTVGHFTITIPVPTDAGSIFWALVYVPQGEQVKSLFATTQAIEGSLYEPNQYVIASGISDANEGPIRIRSAMKRKLQSGDFISLIVGSTNVEYVGQYLNALVSYAIKYN